MSFHNGNFCQSTLCEAVSRRIAALHLESLFVKFGRIKRQHGRVAGLDAVLNRIVRECPFVSRIVPGRIKVRRGNFAGVLKLQYPTTAGLKCIYLGTGTAQEVFLICSDNAKAARWLKSHGLVESAPESAR